MDFYCLEVESKGNKSFSCCRRESAEIQVHNFLGYIGTSGVSSALVVVVHPQPFQKVCSPAWSPDSFMLFPTSWDSAGRGISLGWRLVTAASCLCCRNIVRADTSLWAIGICLVLVLLLLSFKQRH